MSLKSQILRNLDLCFLFVINFNIRRVLRGYKSPKTLFIVGNGPTKEKMFNTALSPDDVVALLNYTKLSSDLKTDFLLLSDHYTFRFRNFLPTIRHVRNIRPKSILLPTRAFFSVPGIVLFFLYPTIFVRYYGSPLWKEEKLQSSITLFDELLSYDTVAFEFGYPLADSLGVNSVVLAGVDLDYGPEENNTEFRRQWRNNIAKSLTKVKNILSFSTYKIDKSTYGDFPIFGEER